MKQAWHFILKALRIGLGISLIVLGIVGGMLPILQGWIFFTAGVLILARDVPFVRRWLHYAEQRIPVLKRVLDQGRHWHDRRRQRKAGVVREAAPPPSPDPASRCPEPRE